ncbi:hypothetical protein [Burkholderia cenocepacia]|nr:hypothetical protein [Burkholderia cenocepacia]
MTLLAVPVATILPRISLSAPRAMTVNEAMRFLCDEVFLSPCQKRIALRCRSQAQEGGRMNQGPENVKGTHAC